jgi:hypothetical protein
MNLKKEINYAYRAQYMDRFGAPVRTAIYLMGLYSTGNISQ